MDIYGLAAPESACKCLTNKLNEYFKTVSLNYFMTVMICLLIYRHNTMEYSLPRNIRKIDKLQTFKSKLKTHLFEQAYKLV